MGERGQRLKESVANPWDNLLFQFTNSLVHRRVLLNQKRDTLVSLCVYRRAAESRGLVSEVFQMKPLLSSVIACSRGRCSFSSALPWQ